MTNRNCPTCSKRIYYGLYCSNDCADLDTIGVIIDHTKPADPIKVTITRPDGTVDNFDFDNWDDAEKFAFDIFESMDTSEARETGIEIHGGNTSVVP